MGHNSLCRVQVTKGKCCVVKYVIFVCIAKSIKCACSGHLMDGALKDNDFTGDVGIVQPKEVHSEKKMLKGF